MNKKIVVGLILGGLLIFALARMAKAAPEIPKAGVKTELQAGQNDWALSAVPLTDYTASTLAASINEQGGTATKIYRWYAGGWQCHRVGYATNDFPIELGQGYLIECTAPSTWIMPIR